MNDSETINALECCVDSTDDICEECAFYCSEHCQSDLIAEALKLIKIQKVKFERYKSVIRLLESDIKTAKSEAIKEFAKFIIDKSENGIIRVSDIPDYAVEITEARDE